MSYETKGHDEIGAPVEIHLSESTKKDTLDTKKYSFSCTRLWLEDKERAMIWILAAAQWAWPQEIPTNDDIEQVGVACVVRVDSESPSLFLQGRQYTLQDQGVAPDKVANDGTYGVFVPTTDEGKVDVALYDRSNLLWMGVIPLPPKNQQTWLVIDEKNAENKPIVTVGFRPIGGENLPPSKRQEQLSWLRLWGILMVGFALGWWLRRPQKVNLELWKPQTASTRQRTEVWEYTELAHMTSALISLGESHSILLCTSVERRALFRDLAQEASVFVPPLHVHTPTTIAAQFQQITMYGAAVIVLDGLHGLSAPLPEEDSLAVFTEIVNNSAQDVVVVFQASDLPEGVSVSKYLNCDQNSD